MKIMFPFYSIHMNMYNEYIWKYCNVCHVIGDIQVLGTFMYNGFHKISIGNLFPIPLVFIQIYIYLNMSTMQISETKDFLILISAVLCIKCSYFIDAKQGTTSCKIILAILVKSDQNVVKTMCVACIC